MVSYTKKCVNVCLNSILPNHTNYVANWAAKLRAMGVTTLRLNDGGEGAIGYRVGIDANWAVTLNNILTLIDSEGFDCYWQCLGDPYGDAEFGINDYSRYQNDGESDGRGGTGLLAIGTVQGLIDQMCDAYVSPTDQHHNFITDSRIVAWDIGNESNIGVEAAGYTVTTNDVFTWLVAIMDYIRGKGAKVIANAFLVGDWNDDMTYIRQYFDGTVGSRHADYYEIHQYGAWQVSHDNYNGGAIDWASWKIWLDGYFDAQIAQKGNFTTDELIMGEFGLPMAPTTDWGFDACSPPLIGSPALQATYFTKYFEVLTGLGTIKWVCPFESFMSGAHQFGVIADSTSYDSYIGTKSSGEFYAAADVIAAAYEATINPEVLPWTDAFANLTKWSVRSGTWSVAGGHLLGSGAGIDLITAGNPTWTNYSVEVNTIINTGALNNESSIVVRYVDDNNFIWMGLGCFGHKYSIGRMLNGVPSEYAYYGLASSLAQNTSYKLKAVAEGSTIQLYVDDVLVLETSISSFPAGALGIRTYNSDIQILDIAAASTEPSVSFTVGRTTVGASNNAFSASIPRATKHTPAETGVLNSISLYLTGSGAGRYAKVAVYADSTGYPGALLAQSTSEEITVDGWHTFTGFSQAVTSGTPIWLAAMASDVNLKWWFDAGGPVYVDCPGLGTYPTYPDPFTAAQTPSNYDPSIYANCTAPSFKKYFNDSISIVDSGSVVDPILPPPPRWQIQYWNTSTLAWTLMPDASLSSITEELLGARAAGTSGAEEFIFNIPNTAANRALLHLDSLTETVNVPIRILYTPSDTLHSITMFGGVCTGAQFTSTNLECIVYNYALLMLQQGDPVNLDYTGEKAATANWILNTIVHLCAEGLESSATSAITEIQFSNVDPYTAALALAKALNLDLWAAMTEPEHGWVWIGNQGSNVVDASAWKIGDETKRGIDRAKQVSKVIVNGWDAADERIQGYASTGIAGATKLFSDDSVNSVETLNNIAAQKLAALNSPTSGTSIVLLTDQAYLLHPGMYITINRVDLNLVGSFIIQRISKGVVLSTLDLEVAAESDPAISQGMIDSLNVLTRRT